jgi:hypothetical protein
MHSQRFLGATFWNYALFHTIHLKNNTPNSKSRLTPHMIVTNGKPVDMDRLSPSEHQLHDLM